MVYQQQCLLLWKSRVNSNAIIGVDRSGGDFHVGRWWGIVVGVVGRLCWHVEVLLWLMEGISSRRRSDRRRRWLHRIRTSGGHVVVHRWHLHIAHLHWRSRVNHSAWSTLPTSADAPQDGDEDGEGNDAAHCAADDQADVARRVRRMRRMTRPLVKVPTDVLRHVVVHAHWTATLVVVADEGVIALLVAGAFTTHRGRSCRCSFHWPPALLVRRIHLQAVVADALLNALVASSLGKV